MCLDVRTLHFLTVRRNVIMRRVRVPIVAMGSNKYHEFCVCVCSLSYPECRANATYCIVMGGLSGFAMFFPHIMS